MFKSLAAAMCAGLLFGCAGGADYVKIDENSHEMYANGVHSGSVVSAAAIMSNPTAFTGATILVEGDIVQVCPHKGCWVKIGDSADPLFVKFKGECKSYLPLDLTGKLIVEGEVEVKELSVEAQKHYLEDEGKHDEAAKITEPSKQVRISASGAARAK